MFDDVGLPIQKKCAVAFIDLLGASHKIEVDSKWTLNSVWLFYSYINEELKSFDNVKYKIFSDNILICEEIDEKNPQKAVLDVFAIVEKIELFMMKIGALFIRGAVSIDDLHYSENFVYGKALLKTYNLESKVANYPRVIIDESIVNIIIDLKIPVLQDNDKLYFYDFLQARINRGGERLSQELATLRGNILVNLKSKNINPKIIKKMEWLINYFNYSCAKNGLKKKITIETLTRFNIDTSNIHLK